MSDPNAIASLIALLQQQQQQQPGAVGPPAKDLSAQYPLPNFGVPPGSSGPPAPAPYGVGQFDALPQPSASGSLALHPSASGSLDYGVDHGRRHGRGRDRSRSPSRREENDRGIQTKVITIRNQYAGQIIGRGGETMKRIERDSNARVQFSPMAVGGSGDRKVEISGTPAEIRACVDLIDEVIEGQDRRDRRGGSSSEGRHRDRRRKEHDRKRYAEDNSSSQEGIILPIKVPDRSVGLIIGRGGEKIRELQDRSGSKINIKGESESINGMRPVLLSGTPETNRLATDLISDIVERDGSGSVFVGDQPAEPAPEPVTLTVQVPNDAVGMLIGKGGEAIRDLQANAHCQIKVQPEYLAVNGVRNVSFIGSSESVQIARTLVDARVAQYHEREAAFAESKRTDVDSKSAVGLDMGATQDPYAQYGGYQNYLNMWQQYFQQQQQQAGSAVGTTPVPLDSSTIPTTAPFQAAMAGQAYAPGAVANSSAPSPGTARTPTPGTTE